MLSQFLLEILLLIFNFLYQQLSLCQNRLSVYIFLSCQTWFHNLSCHEDIVVSAMLPVSIVAWIHCCNDSKNQLRMLYLILYRWSRTVDCQLVLDIFEQIVHLQSDYQWSLNWRLLTLKLSNSSLSHIASAIVEYTVFVINESFIVDNCRSSSCSDNDEFYLDFWSWIFSQFVDELYWDLFHQI